jgi:hypothetical protein
MGHIIDTQLMTALYRSLSHRDKWFLSRYLVTVSNSWCFSAPGFTSSQAGDHLRISHWQSVGQSNLVSGTHLGPSSNLSFFFNLSSDSCWACWCLAPSLTRGRVCSLQLLGLASAVILVSEFQRAYDEILLFQIWDSPTWWARFLYLFPPGTGWHSYSPRH